MWFETRHRFEYHRDPEKTASAWNDRGWSTLGDIGWVDADGYLYLTDRVSNTIISGGVNIYPREVEDVLVVHPAVADVAVLGTPDPDWGEQVVAFVQPMPGTDGERRPGRRADRVVPRPAVALQVPAPGALRRRAAPPPHRQAAQAPPGVSLEVQGIFRGDGFGRGDSGEQAAGGDGRRHPLDRHHVGGACACRRSASAPGPTPR